MASIPIDVREWEDFLDLLRRQQYLIDVLLEERAILEARSDPALCQRCHTAPHIPRGSFCPPCLRVRRNEQLRSCKERQRNRLRKAALALVKAPA